MSIKHYAATCKKESSSEITHLGIRNVNSDNTIGIQSDKTKKQVVEMIEDGKKVYTYFKSNGSWKKGSLIEVYERSGKKHLRTDPDGDESNNLESLPNC